MCKEIITGQIFFLAGYYTTGEILKRLLRNMKNGLPYYESINDKESYARICRMMARAYDIQGNSEKAFSYFQKDFAIQKTPGDISGKRSSATLKASVYLAAGDTVNAAFYYKQAALVSINEHELVEAYHANMANVYRLQKNYDSALQQMRYSQQKLQSSNTDSLFRRVALMTSYNLLTNVFLSLKKYDSVIYYCQQTLFFFKDGDYVTALLPTLNNIAAAYSGKNQYSKALYYSDLLLAYAQRSGARRFKRDAYKLLWRIFMRNNITLI